MKAINSDYTAGRQIVVYDQVDSTYVGGVQVDPAEANKRFKDGILPAGTLLVPGDSGMFKPLNAALSDTNVAGAIGLTHFDVKIDDMPLVSVVQAGTVRKDALPDKENAGVDTIRKVLPRLSFY